MEPSLNQLRRDARKLSKAFAANASGARARVAALQGAEMPEKHIDFLHIIARERGFASWPRLKLAAETRGLDRAAREARLRGALYFGRHNVVTHLLEEDPDLGLGVFELEVALFRVDAVREALKNDPSLATRDAHGRRPILHLAFSRHIEARPEKEPDLLAIAEILLTHGADVNDGFPHEPGSDHLLPALYGAIGHTSNMALAQWLLDHGANPNDNESLYHSTELGHHEGLKMLLAAGAELKGTNTLFRAMDFDDVEAVRLLIEAGADVDEFNDAEVGGEAPWVIRALHQMARRGCSTEMVDLVLAHVTDLNARHAGTLPYAFARVFGHEVLAGRLAAAGADTTMTTIEERLATAVHGPVQADALRGIDIPEAYADIIRMILHLPGRRPQVERLLKLGLDPDRPDEFGLTPLHIAGWEGLPEMMQLFCDAGGSLDHINGYGGTLLSTVLHGSENNPTMQGRDHPACARLVLEWGAPLPQLYLDNTGREDMLAVLGDWAEAHPDSVV